MPLLHVPPTAGRLYLGGSDTGLVDHKTHTLKNQEKLTEKKSSLPNLTHQLNQRVSIFPELVIEVGTFPFIYIGKEQT